MLRSLQNKVTKMLNHIAHLCITILNAETRRKEDRKDTLIHHLMKNTYRTMENALNKGRKQQNQNQTANIVVSCDYPKCDILRTEDIVRTVIFICQNY